MCVSIVSHFTVMFARGTCVLREALVNTVVSKSPLHIPWPTEGVMLVLHIHGSLGCMLQTALHLAIWAHYQALQYVCTYVCT